MSGKPDGVCPKNYFSKTADDYDLWYETKVGRFIDRVETKLAFRMLPPQEGWRVLDAGCGTGNFTFKLARRGCRVTGIDISPDMLRQAQQKLCGYPQQQHPVEFEQMDMNHLKFPDGTFDAVYSMSAFEFVDEPEEAFSQLWRVVKPGGKILIGTIAGDSSWGQAYRKKAESDPDSVFNHARFGRREEYEQLCSEDVIDSGECLFIPADAPASMFTMTEEERYSTSRTGGFFCVLWKRSDAEDAFN